MTDRDGLLAAILAEPEDDAPRLVFADWLEEHGEVELGEFIRLQCLIEPGIHANLLTPDMAAAIPRHNALVSLMDAKARAQFPFLQNIIFRRGFVDEISCTAAHWLHYAETVLVRCPIREVSLTTYLEIAYLAGSLCFVGRRDACPESPEIRPAKKNMPLAEIGTIQDVRVFLAEEWPGIKFHAHRSRNRLIDQELVI